LSISDNTASGSQKVALTGTGRGLPALFAFLVASSVVLRLGDGPFPTVAFHREASGTGLSPSSPPRIEAI
jgi:hypothetical protein